MANFENWDWVKEDELPQIGTQCPKCQQGYIQEFSGKSKKTGNEYHGVKCDQCYYKWTVSFKSQGTLGGTGGVHKRFDEMSEWANKEVEPRLKKIDEIHEMIKTLKDSMTNL